ncbi:MAG: hypothetical protein IJI58_01635 [Bacilli bacterium]|nr:hypothetical protein [Bacilli bacterium]
MYDQYLIPANTKRGRLILGWFRPFDLALFGTGILISLIMLAFLQFDDIVSVIVGLAPALITGFLVMPVPNYHNMLNIIMEAYEFLTNRQRYEWKGWCYKSVSKKTKR